MCGKSSFASLQTEIRWTAQELLNDQACSGHKVVHLASEIGPGDILPIVDRARCLGEHFGVLGVAHVYPSWPN
jgi:hypothetical protein